MSQDFGKSGLLFGRMSDPLSKIIRPLFHNSCKFDILGCYYTSTSSGSPIVNIVLTDGISISWMKNKSTLSHLLQHPYLEYLELSPLISMDNRISDYFKAIVLDYTDKPNDDIIISLLTGKHIQHLQDKIINILHESDDIISYKGDTKHIYAKDKENIFSKSIEVPCSMNRNIEDDDGYYHHLVETVVNIIELSNDNPDLLNMLKNTIGALNNKEKDILRDIFKQKEISYDEIHNILGIEISNEDKVLIIRGNSVEHINYENKVDELKEFTNRLILDIKEGKTPCIDINHLISITNNISSMFNKSNTIAHIKKEISIPAVITLSEKKNIELPFDNKRKIIKLTTNRSQIESLSIDDINEALKLLEEFSSDKRYEELRASLSRRLSILLSL